MHRISDPIADDQERRTDRLALTDSDIGKQERRYVGHLNHGRRLVNEPASTVPDLEHLVAPPANEEQSHYIAPLAALLAAGKHAGFDPDDRKPHLGDLPLAGLRPVYIERMHALIAAGDGDERPVPLSVASVRRIHASLTSALNTAARRMPFCVGVWELRRFQSTHLRRASLKMRLSPDRPVAFDDPNLVWAGGLVWVLALAESARRATSPVSTSRSSRTATRVLAEVSKAAQRPISQLSVGGHGVVRERSVDQMQDERRCEADR